MLPDGRAAAITVPGKRDDLAAMAARGEIPEEPRHLVVFIQQDGRWLVDEGYPLSSVGEYVATPSAATPAA